MLILRANNPLDSASALTIILVMTTPPRRFVITYAPQIKAQLRPIARKFYTVIRRTIEEQLTVEPDVETTNRKPLTRPVECGQRGNSAVGRRIGFACFMRLIRSTAVWGFWPSASSVGIA